MAQTVEEIIIDLRLKTQALEEGLAAATHQIEQFTNKSEAAARKQAQAAQKSAHEQEIAYAAISAAGIAAFAKITSAIQTGITAANAYISALTGLRSVADGTGQDFGALQTQLNTLTADGLIPVSDAATALKNLLARGFDANQAIDMLNRLKDSAAFGRQASLTMGEAVRSASEGLKNENSILVDNAGVTKNVSVMWKEYAQQIGKGVDSLTTAEKRQAEYNGIMNETRFQVGDAAKYAATYAGAQAELSASTLRLEQAHGSAMQNALLPFVQVLSSIVDGLAGLTQSSPEAAAGLTAAALAAVLTAAGFAAVAVAGKQLTVVLMALKVAAGPIGWISLVVGALAGLIVNLTSASQATEEYTQKLQDSINTTKQSIAALREYQAALKDNATADLVAARQKIIDQFPELVTGYDAEGNAIIASNDAIQAKIDLLDKQIAKQKESLLLTANADIATASSNIERLSNEYNEQERIHDEAMAEYDRYAAIVEEKERQINEARAAGRQDTAGQIEASMRGEQASMSAYYAIAKAAIEEMSRITGESAANQSTLSQRRLLQYEQEASAMGALTEAQQYLVQVETDQALAFGLTAEQFRANADEAITDTDRLAAAERVLAAQAAVNSDAVKEWADHEKNLKKVQDSNAAVMQAEKIKGYAATVKAGAKGTREYAEALKGLSEHFKMSGEAVEANIDDLVGLADIGLDGATKAQEALRASLQAAIADYKATGAAGEEAAKKLELFLAMIGQPYGGGSSSGGGGGSTRKKAWEEELDMIERVSDAEDEYAQAYLDHINSLLASDRFSKSERKRLEQERAYAEMQINGQLEQAHIDYLERVLRRERLNAEQRLDVEQRLFEAKRALMDTYQDFADAITGAITARAEAQRDAELSAIQAQINAVSDWEDAQSDAIRAVMDERLDAINAQIRALDDLSKAQDRADKDEQDADKLRRLQAQLEYEKDERNRLKLTEQIAALEAATKKRHDQEQLEDQKQALKDQQETIRNEADAQLEAVRLQAEQERTILNARLAAAQAYWEQRLSGESIMQEAILFLQQSSQEEIMALLEKYAPEYLNKGKLLGSQLLGGLKPKIDACLAEIARLRAEAEKPITVTVVYNTIGSPSTGGTSSGSKSSGGVRSLLSSISSFAAAPDAAVKSLLVSAQSRVDNFAARSLQAGVRSTSEAGNAFGVGQKAAVRNVKVEQTVIMQQPVPTPYQNARALRRESENLAKLL